MIESLRTTQTAFFRFATLCGFFRGSADEVQNVSVQGLVQEKIIWNHLWEHRFLVPDTRGFPPPGGRFSPQTTESPFYDWAHRQTSNEWMSVLATLSIIVTPNTRLVLPQLQSIIEFLSLNLSDLCNKISLCNIIDNSAAKNSIKRQIV